LNLETAAIGVYEMALFTGFEGVVSLDVEKNLFSG